MQVQNMKMTVEREDRLTVIAVNMGLYQPAKKLQMTCKDLGHIILRPDQLHVVMARLNYQLQTRESGGNRAYVMPNFAQSVHLS